MRHARIMYQDGDNGDVASERRSDFQAHEVVVVVEAAFSICTGDGRPLRSDDGQKDTAAGDVVVDGFAEVEARSNAGDGHKNRVIAKDTNKVVKEPSRLAL